MRLAYRPGQWVKFKPLKPIEGAHTLKDGFVVAIYDRGGRESDVSVKTEKGTVALPKWSPAKIVVVTPTGGNVAYMTQDKDGNPVLNHRLWFPPETCPQLQPVLKRDEIPEARLATVPKNWQPTE